MSLKYNQVFVGSALSDVNRADDQLNLRVPENLGQYIHMAREALATSYFCMELQPEQPWIQYQNGHFVSCKNSWTKISNHPADNFAWIRREIFNQPRILGVHAPNLQIDVLDTCSDGFKRQESISSIIEAMRWANQIKADYFVIHLCQTDRWRDNSYRRDVQIPKSLKIFNFLASIYRKEHFQFVPCIEILEYPKYPATPYEIRTILNSCQQILPQTRLAFDIAHLWRSRSLICETQHQEFENIRFKSFNEELQDTLDILSNDDVYIWHLGGCFETETHAIPGIYPDEDPFSAFYRLDISGAYDESREMDISKALDIVIHYCSIHHQPLRIILEIHRENYNVILKAMKEINWAIYKKIAGR